jgi:7-keto-8-aminopelargonate synthetase-like enzyme
LWQHARVLDGAPGPIAQVREEGGAAARGINLASQDYLSLASHPAVHEAALRALREAGPHSAGCAATLGATRLSLALERALGELLQLEHVALFPSGWSAAIGALTALLHGRDHVVIDQLAHGALRQGALAATGNVHTQRHLDTCHLRELLATIRARDTDNAILVVTEGLFSMESDSPDLPLMQYLCREYGATLLVDAAHDLGALGPGGSGRIGQQGMLGKVDIVIGSFSKTFAANGGFMACAAPALKRQVQLFAGPQLFSNALSPLAAGVALESLRIVASSEGEALRAGLLRNAETVRRLLAGAGARCLGAPSPIVPVLVGAEAAARLAGRLLARRRVFVNQPEYPAVPPGAARLRLQLMEAHSQQQLQRAATLVGESIASANAALAGHSAGAAWAR